MNTGSAHSPLVSVLIPLYNAEKYLSECLDSVIAQTYKNIEIIIVNDGSTDDSLSIAESYAKQYSCIKVYSQENSGAQIARNKAFELSSGQYIQYFDADDIMHPNKIFFQIEALRLYGFDEQIVATGKWMTFTDTIETAIYKNQVINKNYENSFLFFKESWQNGNYMIGQAWLIPRALNDKIGEWDTRLVRHQDGEFFARVVYNASKIVFAEKSIVYYRKGVPNSISSTRSYKSMRSHLDYYHSYYNLLKNDLKKFSLYKDLAKLYSDFYMMYYPLDKKIEKEILNRLKELGYSEPLIDYKHKCMWVVKWLGIDIGLRLRKWCKKTAEILRMIEN